jgi:hypothetical protein
MPMPHPGYNGAAPSGGLLATDDMAKYTNMTYIIQEGERSSSRLDHRQSAERLMGTAGRPAKLANAHVLEETDSRHDPPSGSTE